MASAMARGIGKAGIARPDEMIASARSEESRRKFLSDPALNNVRWTCDNGQVVRESETIILAVKPQQFGEVLPTFQKEAAGKLFISVAAGITLARLRELLGDKARVIRAMPNQGMVVGEGASVYAGGPEITAEEFERGHAILTAGGKAWRVEEELINVITAVSGSGPAYVFHFIEALTLAGVAQGLVREFALALAVQTVLGGAQMAAQSGEEPLVLADRIKSPKGTTIAACEVLESDLNDLMIRTVEAARKRAEELAGVPRS